MRIAVVNLTGGGLSGGYRKYLQNIMPIMVKDARVTDLKVFLPAGNDNLILGSTVTVHSIPSFTMLRTVSWLKKEMAVWKPDVVFIPTARVFSCGDIPVIVMIRNMEPLVVPFIGNPARECIINIGRIMIARQACRRADRVIAVSNYVKKYLVEKWHIKEHRIGVVYHGIKAEPHRSGNSERAIASLESFPFIFTAGSIRPARGLEDIIRALAILNTKQSIQLAIGGNVDPGMDRYFIKLKKLAENLGITECIHWLGKLNDSEMAWYYSHCDAFIMTSRVEACPNVVLEAMANGCICVSTKTPPMPEFFKDWAFYYPPGDGQALSQAIKLALGIDSYKKSELSEVAKKRASEFSWDICAEKTVSELERAIKDFRVRNNYNI